MNVKMNVMNVNTRKCLYMKVSDKEHEGKYNSNPNCRLVSVSDQNQRRYSYLPQYLLLYFYKARIFY